MILSVVASMPGSDDKELIKNIPATQNADGSVQLQSLIERLIEIGYPVQSSLVSYFSPADDIYTFVRREPLLDSDSIPASCIVDDRVYLKFRYNEQLTGDVTEPREEGKREEADSDFEGEILSTPQEIWSNGKANRRTKERKISFVIEKVSMWRKLYNGVPTKGGKTIRYSLEEAAAKVGISKKSLDDYLLQLRYGKKYEFDFGCQPI